MLKFSVNRKEFSTALSLAVGAVEVRHTILILGHVLILGDGNSLHVKATDLETSMITECAAEVGTHGSIALPAKRLLSYVKQLTGETLSFSSTEKHWASLSCGGSSAKIAGMPETSWPAIPDMPSTSVALPLADLQRMVRTILVSVPVGEQKFGIKAGRIGTKDGILRMASSNGASLAIAEAAGDVQVEPVLLNRSSLIQIMRLSGESVQYAFEDNHTFFKVDGCLLVSRKVEQRFPNYEQHLKILKQETVLIASREEMKSAFQRAVGFVDEKNTFVDLNVNGTVEIVGAMVDSGESKELVTAEVEGPKVSCRVDAAYFINFLGSFTAEKVRVRMGDEKTPISIEAITDSLQMALIQPIWKTTN